MISFKHKYFIAKNLARISPMQGRQKRTLMYHSIPTFKSINDHYAVDINSFKDQINFLIDKDISFSSSFEDNLQSVSLTFDDGYADNLYHAAPFLVSKKIPFTVFVVSAFVKNSEKGYLNPVELKHLASLPGVVIGAHGRTHKPLASLHFDEARKELEMSKLEIEEIIGKEINCMSFPHGSYNEKIYQSAKDLQFFKIATSEIRPRLRDQTKMGRLPVFSYDCPSDIWNKVKGKWDLIGALM